MVLGVYSAPPAEHFLPGKHYASSPITELQSHVSFGKKMRELDPSGAMVTWTLLDSLQYFSMITYHQRTQAVLCTAGDPSCALYSRGPKLCFVQPGTQAVLCTAGDPSCALYSRLARFPLFTHYTFAVTG